MDTEQQQEQTPVENITIEEAYAFRAIEMWYNVVERCQILHNNINDKKHDDYKVFIDNVLNNQNTEKEVKQQIQKVIADFYDYFYKKKHIAHLNYRQYDRLTDDYANFGTTIANIISGGVGGVCSREGKELINILIEVSLYTFEKISPFRKKWGLFVFEEEKQDEYLVLYFSNYDEREPEPEKLN